MPIYEYRCDACSHYLDALQKISDAPLTDCPECGKPVLKRLISAPSFRLKGSGWYETDFKSDKERKRNLVESGEKAGGDKSTESSGGDGKSESKSESKADSKSDTKKPAVGSKDKPKGNGKGTEAA
jgi:putative FmdB family regulatory protein